jgi:hypothetical protein
MVGTWILSIAGASSALAVIAPKSSEAGAVSAAAGTALATYPAVLVGNTAVPAWQATRSRLPPWFAATSAASLASLVELAMPQHDVSRYGAVAKAATLVTAYAVERKAIAAGVGRPFREGRSGLLWRGAWWLGAASLIATLAGQRRIAGALGTVAGVASRFAILAIGRASAADPRASFEPQRTRARATV